MDPADLGSSTAFESRHDSNYWKQARAFLRRRLEAELWRTQGADLDDLTQEACLRLLRALRRAPADNAEALMTEIARRTAIDFLRSVHRRLRWTTPLDAVEARVGNPSADPESLGDPTARLQFVVLEFFASRHALCRHLALAYFERRDWRVVALEVGKSHSAVRKQWSRCVQTLREALSDHHLGLTEPLSSGGEE